MPSKREAAPPLGEYLPPFDQRQADAQTFIYALWLQPQGAELLPQPL